MAVDFCIKQNDTWPKLQVQALTASGSTIDLTNASTVVFRGVKINGAATITGGASVTDGSAGSVEYDWGTTGTVDTARPVTAGDYKGEFGISFSDDSTARIPNNGYISIRVLSKVL